MFPRWWRETWRQPGWEVRLWTDSDIAAFVGRLPARIRRLFDSYPLSVMRADAFRYLLLRQEGGLYVDLDFVNLGSLDWLGAHPAFTCAEQGDGCLCNAFLWAPRAGDPFWSGIEEALLSHASEENPVSATGPRFLTAYAEGRPHERLSPSTIYPVAWDDFPSIASARASDLHRLQLSHPEARAIHIWTGSWFAQCGMPTPSQSARDRGAA